jgi:hypothetical protein
MDLAESAPRHDSRFAEGRTYLGSLVLVCIWAAILTLLLALLADNAVATATARVLL